MPKSIVDKKDVIAKYGDIFNPKKEAYEKLKGEIRFENVTFDYGNGVEVIHPLSSISKRALRSRSSARPGAARPRWSTSSAASTNPPRARSTSMESIISTALWAGSGATSAMSSKQPSFSRAVLQGQHPLWQIERHAMKRSSQRPNSSASMISSWLSQRLRHHPRRWRRLALPRPETAGFLRPRHHPQPLDPDPR
jgi:hypothetical protein